MEYEEMFRGLLTVVAEAAVDADLAVKRRAGDTIVVHDASPEEIIRKLRELMGQRGPDVKRLRVRLNGQLVSAQRKFLEDIMDDADPRTRRALEGMSIPARQVFASRLADLRELYLDDAVERIEGEADWLKESFLTKLVAWAEGETTELNVSRLMADMAQTSASRARFFARDQFSRFNRSLLVSTYREAEAPYIEWITSGDERVRDAHRERNHRIYTPGGLIADPEWKSYNCILPGAKIEGAIVAGSKAWYSGGVKVIVTSGGSKLSVTPNHPVLTLRGWMPARLLQKGDRLFRHEVGSELNTAFGGFPDEEYVPTPIEDVFGALLPHGSVECRATYFHGDGEYVKGQIQTVTAARLLRNDRVAEPPEFGRDGSFESTFLPVWSEPSSLSPERFADHSRLVGVGPFGRRPGGSTLTLDQPSIQLHPAPLRPLRFGSASRLYSCVDQAAKDRGSVDPELVGQLFAARSLGIETDEVVDIQDSSFSGHVYDLQSVTGWIIAESLLVGNCRCGFAPVYGPLSEAQKRRLAA